MDEREFLEKYDVNKYDRPSVTNDILIFTAEDIIEENKRKVPKKGLQVLLIKREEHPFIDSYVIPGGFVKNDESLEEGARRKLKEETGIDDLYIEQLYTLGDLDRDPRTRVISVSNMALISKNKIKYDECLKKTGSWFWVRLTEETRSFYKGYKEIVEVLEIESESGEEKVTYKITQKISSDQLKNLNTEYELISSSNLVLGFDHFKLIHKGIERIRNKVEYTPIAFNLLPELFTVKELQNVYEGIIGREIQNFRRKICDMIIETNEKIEGRPFRPAKIFKFNEAWKSKF